PLLYSMRSAFESDASFPMLLAAGDAGAMCAIDAGGVSSLRKRLRNPPPLFFLSLSVVASGDPGCGGGGAHSSVRADEVSLAGDSCGGAGERHGLAFGGSLGFALGAHAFAGASFDAGVAVIQDSAGAPV